MTSSDEHAVVVRAQAGDRSAVGELYSAYHDEVFRYLYYQVGDHHTAEDLAAEVFERMIRALPRYEEQGVRFQAWLFRIARNAAVDYFRKTNMRKLITFDESWHASEAFDATPSPKWVIAAGDCACCGGEFGISYASCGAVENVIPVDVKIPGCPPTPEQLLTGILGLLQSRPNAEG